MKGRHIGIKRETASPPKRGIKCPNSGQYAMAALGDVVRCPTCGHFVPHGTYGLVRHYVPVEALREV